MARLRYRWLLPLGHALVDAIVISHIIWRVPTWHLAQPSVQTTSELLLNARSVDVMLLVSGTLPAGVIHVTVEMRGISWGRYDIVLPGLAPFESCAWAWVALFEMCALTFWFLMGSWSDSRGPPLRRVLCGYLMLRFALVPLCWSELSGPGIGLELMFWLIFAVYALVLGCRWLLRRVHA